MLASVSSENVNSGLIQTVVFITNLSNANPKCVYRVRGAAAFTGTVGVQHMLQEYFWIGQLGVLVSLRSDRWIILDVHHAATIAAPVTAFL